MKDSRDHYLDRRKRLETSLSRIRKRNTAISVLRLLTFLITLILIYLFANSNLPAMIITLVLGIALFLVLVRWHAKVLARLKHIQHLLQLTIKELASLQHQLEGFEPGKELDDPEHPFAADLDLFGEGSLFQFLNRTTTYPGKSTLAGFLKHPLTERFTILRRQAAIRELSERPDWDHEFLATGLETKEKPDDRKEILEWLETPPEFNKPVIWLWLIMAPLVAFGTTALVAFSILPPVLLLVPITFSFSILAHYLRKTNKQHRNLGKKSGIIEKYALLLRMIEEVDFQSELLLDFQGQLTREGAAPSREVKKLSRILNAFDNRLNLIMGFLLNLFLLWDIIQSKRAENWIARHKDDLPGWIDVMATTDALISFAIFRFNWPGTVFPAISNEEFHLTGRALGHPLIPPGQLVGNPVDLTNFGQLYIITGANMAGKSTYLRTVGVNLVLAMAGSAVLAEELTFSPVRIMTSIRTTDSLYKNESYFYAELKHLARIIETLEEGQPLFILLDEMLKGTNSRDKQEGSRGLIRKLMKFPVTGLVATHDLALGELEEEYPGRVINKSFEVVIKDDRLVFDYLLKNGIAKQMNATFLMKKMGITE